MDVEPSRALRRPTTASFPTSIIVVVVIIILLVVTRVGACVVGLG
jgi:hypothetical protein